MSMYDTGLDMGYNTESGRAYLAAFNARPVNAPVEPQIPDKCDEPITIVAVVAFVVLMIAVVIFSPALAAGWLFERIGKWIIA